VGFAPYRCRDQRGPLAHGGLRRRSIHCHESLEPRSRPKRLGGKQLKALLSRLDQKYRRLGFAFVWSIRGGGRNRKAYSAGWTGPVINLCGGGFARVSAAAVETRLRFHRSTIAGRCQPGRGWWECLAWESLPRATRRAGGIRAAAAKTESSITRPIATAAVSPNALWKKKKCNPGNFRG